MGPSPDNSRAVHKAVYSQHALRPLKSTFVSGVAVGETEQ